MSRSSFRLAMAILVIGPVLFSMIEQNTRGVLPCLLMASAVVVAWKWRHWTAFVGVGGVFLWVLSIQIRWMSDPSEMPKWGASLIVIAATQLFVLAYSLKPLPEFNHEKKEESNK